MKFIICYYLHQQNLLFPILFLTFIKPLSAQILTSNNCLLGMLPPLFGTVSYSQQTGPPYPSGSTATMVCQQGGTPLNGQSTAFCTNGVWNPPIFPSCSTPAFSNLLPSNNLMFPGNTFSGTAAFGAGIGTTTQGGCFLGLTAMGGTVQYSMNQINGAYPQGTLATLICSNGGFPTGGTSTSNCQNGSWQPNTLGFCSTTGTGMSPAGSLFGSNPLAFGTSTANTGSCFIGPMNPLFGQISYSNGQTMPPFPSGTTASVTCLSGFIPNGQTTATCINGQFNPQVLGSCISASGK